MPPVQAAEPSTHGPGPRVLGGRLCAPHPRRGPQASRASSRWVSPGERGSCFGAGLHGWPPDLPRVGQALPWLWAFAVSPSRPGPWWSGQGSRAVPDSTAPGAQLGWGSGGAGTGGSSHTDQLPDTLDAWEARMELWHPLPTPTGRQPPRWLSLRSRGLRAQGWQLGVDLASPR